MSTRVLATITPEDVTEHLDHLRRWIEANGIDPYTVSATHPVTIEQVGERTVICYRECQRNQHGQILVDPDDNGQALTVRRAVDQRVRLGDVCHCQHWALRPDAQALGTHVNLPTGMLADPEGEARPDPFGALASGMARAAPGGQST